MKYQVLVKLRKDFIEVKDGVIVAGVMSPPEKGKANEEVIRKIAAYFHVPRPSVKIVTGASSRRKIVKVGD